MSDYISREAAMEIVKRTSGDYAAAFSEIRKLPAADVEPVRQNKIGDLKYDAQEREKAVVQIRKQWQDAEMFICTMCGHFYHNIDGNIVYGNKDCGEIVGYPYCKKFTPWIPASVRLPAFSTSWRIRTMTIDRAIEILNPEHREHYDGMDEVNEACRMGMEALERTRWIPCSERLPELQDTRWVRTVIVCARGHVMPMIYERDIVQGKAVGRWKWMWREIFNEPEAITHWMPLPEPPVKEGT